MKSKSVTITEGAVEATADEGLTENDSITCSVHGNSGPTFVCKHLIELPVQKWCCGYPREDNPWPDAWCVECNAAFEREGEWNERNEGSIDIKLLCSGCYDEGIAKSVDRLTGEPLEAWKTWAGNCRQVARQKQDVLSERLQINGYPRWDYYQESAQLILSGSDIPDLIADVEFVGTFSTASNTWKWAWANFSLLATVRSRIGAVRDYGEVQGYPHLLVPMWHADQSDGWLMASVAAEILGAQGIYRAPTEQGFIFMVMMDAGHAKP